MQFDMLFTYLTIKEKTDNIALIFVVTLVNALYRRGFSSNLNLKMLSYASKAVFKFTIIIPLKMKLSIISLKNVHYFIEEDV